VDPNLDRVKPGVFTVQRPFRMETVRSGLASSSSCPSVGATRRCLSCRSPSAVIDPYCAWAPTMQSVA